MPEGPRISQSQGLRPPDPFGVFSEEKTREKLDYMHNNPVKRRLVASPADWPWSSWRFYDLGDRSILEMDRVDQESSELAMGNRDLKNFQS